MHTTPPGKVLFFAAYGSREWIISCSGQSRNCGDVALQAVSGYSLAGLKQVDLAGL